MLTTMFNNNNNNIEIITPKNYVSFTLNISVVKNTTPSYKNSLSLNITHVIIKTIPNMNRDPRPYGCDLEKFHQICYPDALQFRNLARTSSRKEDCNDAPKLIR